ncbi:hypothetical protein C8F01DRAFT_1167603 [Mycena amicta]|nr:hypothetical protein C8F01DRAFT_1167603 [Mycena amicta]
MSDVHLPSTVVADERLNHYLFLFAFTVLLYDHLLTLPSEVRFIWPRPTRASTFWFLLNRYLALLTNVLVAVFTLAPIPDADCASLLLAKKMFVIAQQVVVYIILALRVYAMFGLNRRLFFGLIGAGIIALLIGVWLTVTDTDHKPNLGFGGPDHGFGNSTFPPPPPFNASLPLPSFNVIDAAPNQASGMLPPGAVKVQCFQPIFHSSAIRIAGAWEGMLVLEAIIFGLTVYRALAFRWLAGKEHHSSLITLLVRDGAWYFLAIVMVNAANLFMYYPFIAASMSWLASNLSATLVARLMLNVHEAADHDSDIYGARFYDDSNSSIVFVHPARAMPVARSGRSPVSDDGHAWSPEVARYMHERREIQLQRMGMGMGIGAARREWGGAADLMIKGDSDILTRPPERVSRTRDLERRR